LSTQLREESSFPIAAPRMGTATSQAARSADFITGN